MEVTNERDEIEIDLFALGRELFSHWVMIALSALLVATIVLCYTKLLITPQYESTSELYVLSQSTSITSLADIQIGTNLTNDYIVVTTDRPVLDQVIANLGLHLNYSQLSNKITVKNPNNSRILQITVRDADPHAAKSIADEIASVSSAFIAEKMGQEAPNIISYGYADNDPVSPSPAKNALIGAFLGALLSAAIIAVAYLMDNTIKTPDDVEQKLGLTILGTLPLESESDYNGHTPTRRKWF